MGLTLWLNKMTITYSFISGSGTGDSGGIPTTTLQPVRGSSVSEQLEPIVFTAPTGQAFEGLPHWILYNSFNGQQVIEGDGFGPDRISLVPLNPGSYRVKTTGTYASGIPWQIENLLRIEPSYTLKVQPSGDDLIEGQLYEITTNEFTLRLDTESHVTPTVSGATATTTLDGLRDWDIVIIATSIETEVAVNLNFLSVEDIQRNHSFKLRKV